MARKRKQSEPPLANDVPAGRFVAADIDTGEIREISRLNDDGQEIPDPRPVAASLGIRPIKTLNEQVRELFLAEQLARDIQRQGFESYDEANDFDVGDDEELWTEYELDEFRGELAPGQTDPMHPALRSEQFRQQQQRQQQDAPPSPPPAPPTPPPPSGSTDQSSGQ